ncbi:MAG: uncharacterized protein PWP49_253 [Thermococcaceae archaeon]|nr:uncharacterized protein [Thermococcaceae archaeon]MDN5319833.1 uncharacterized protein [Thermococcaceae archaeon]
MTRLFIDSGILIEYFKGERNAVELFDEILDLVKEGKVSVVVNPIVFSEVVVILAKYSTGKSYLTLRKNPELITKNEQLKEVITYLLSPIFTRVGILPAIEDIAGELIIRYGLLPNDAFILATCKFYRVKYLISFDSDFEDACKKEGIVLIDNIKKLKKELGE